MCTCMWAGSREGMWLGSNKSRLQSSQTPEIKNARRRFRDSRALQQNSTRQLHTVPWQQARHWSWLRFEMTNGRAGSGWCVLLGKHDAVGRYGSRTALKKPASTRGTKGVTQRRITITLRGGCWGCVSILSYSWGSLKRLYNVYLLQDSSLYSGFLRYSLKNKSHC